MNMESLLRVFDARNQKRQLLLDEFVFAEFFAQFLGFFYVIFSNFLVTLGVGESCAFEIFLAAHGKYLIFSLKFSYVKGII